MKGESREGEGKGRGGEWEGREGRGGKEKGRDEPPLFKSWMRRCCRCVLSPPALFSFIHLLGNNDVWFYTYDETVAKKCADNMSAILCYFFPVILRERVREI